GREAVQAAFARLLGAERPQRVHALDQEHLDRGRFDDRWDAVVDHVGAQRQAFVVLRLFAHRLAHAHPDRALHLAFDGQRVDGTTAIMRNPDLLDPDVAGFLVDFDLDDLRAVAEARRRADGGAAELAALRFRRRRPGALHAD